MQTVAQLIERFIAEMGTFEKPGLKPIGKSQFYTLGLLKDSRFIGPKLATELKKTDVIDHCKERRKKVCGATVQQDIIFLSGVLKYAPSAWEDCEEVSDAAVAAAKPMLIKYGLIGKSTPRKRVPTDEELAALLNYYATPRKSGKQRTLPMPDIIAFALVSTRRISEICRIRRSDIDWERKADNDTPTPMYKVRDLKHPTKKKGNDKWFPLFPELAEIINRQPIHPTDDRVFPHNAKSASASYTIAKRRLGIQGLRFHDCRRAAITHWLKVFKNPHKVKQISGHETTVILERVYDASDPALLHADLAAMKPANVQPL